MNTDINIILDKDDKPYTTLEQLLYVLPLKSHNLIKEEYTLLENIVPISEEYTGSNGVRYKHIYYYALYKGTKVLSINPEKHEQFSEIGDIKWLTIDECKSKIRVEHPTKLDIIQKVSEFMMNWKNDLILKE